MKPAGPVAILANADSPRQAEFLKGADKKRLLFPDRDTAEQWLEANADPAIDYRVFDGTD